MKRDTSRRDLYRELATLADDLDAAGDGPDRCPDCGGRPSGFDAAESVTAPFVTYECTCGASDDLPDTAGRFRGGS